MLQIEITYIANRTFARVHADPNPYLFIRGPVGCLPPETEFLTTGGWKKISEYADGDLVAQWYPDTHQFELVAPQAYIKVIADNPLLHIHNQHSVDMVLSADHRVPYYDWRGVLRESPAVHIASKILTRTEGPRYRIPITTGLPSSQVGVDLSDHDLRLMVAIHADGYFTRTQIQSCEMCLRKERKLQRIRALLTAAQRPWRERTNQRGECIITFQAPQRSKQYGPEWWKITHHQAEVIFDEFRYWDGLVHDDGELRYYSANKRDADFIQFVSHTLGHRATISKVDYQEHENWRSNYTVFIARQAGDSSTFRNCSCTTQKSSDGYQYCFTVPTSYFVARHNGRVFVTGNSGKSSGCIMHLFLNAIQQQPNQRGIRKTRFAVIRSSYPALKTTVVKSWQSWFEDHIKIVYDVPIRGTIEMDLADGTRLDMELHFIALDREDNVHKLQSLELTGAHINETAEIPKGIFDMLKTRVNRYPAKREGGATKHVIISDYNSVDISHWLYQMAEEQKPHLHSFYTQPPALFWDGKTYSINPNADNLENLPDSYYLDMVEGNDQDFINVYILNNYGSLRHGRPVYPLYEDRVHAIDRIIKPLEGVPLVVGMDVGLDPAAVVTQLSPTGKMLVIQELVSNNTSIRTFADEYLWPMIRNKYGKLPFDVVVDPAARNRSANDKRSAMDILVQAGLPVRLARTNEDLARREAVNYFLTKRDGFLLSGIGAPIIRKGFISEYKYPKLNTSAFQARYKEKPDKNEYSHPHDALQYAALELSEGRTLKKRTRRYKSKSTSPADREAGY